MAHTDIDQNATETVERFGADDTAISDTETVAVEGAPLALGEPAAIVHETEEHHASCPQCGTKVGWRGALDPTSDVWSRGIDQTTGMPCCPACGTALIANEPIPVAEALQQVAQALDTERAGDAARPMFQPSIPGVLPAFNAREAMLRIEYAEREVQSTEDAWEKAKKIAADRKKEYDEAVETLRAEIKAQHELRINAEYQHGRASTEAVSVTPAAAPDGPCLFEVVTEEPCGICRNADANASGRLHRAERSHVGSSLAAMVVTAVRAGDVDAIERAGLTVHTVLRWLPDWYVDLEQIRQWAHEDLLAVAAWLEGFASADEPWARPVPLLLGTAHEAAEASGERQSCRACGACLRDAAVLQVLDPFAVGFRVGTDCPGEEQEAAPTPRRRHASRKAAQVAKQKADAEAADVVRVDHADDVTDADDDDTQPDNLPEPAPRAKKGGRR